MSGIKAVRESLEEAIENARVEALGEHLGGGQLLAASGEALGVLKILGDLSASQILYDFARLAGRAGDTPEDFEEKSRQDLNQ